MKLDLETLKQVKFTFELHSDHSTNCNGYRRLCEMIIEAEREASHQTAVEWLVEQLTPSISLQQKHIDRYKILAMEMEKNQIINTFQAAQVFKVMEYETRAEEFYIETYGK
jgi:hypothetical protein